MKMMKKVIQNHQKVKFNPPKYENASVHKSP